MVGVFEPSSGSQNHQRNNDDDQVRWWDKFNPITIRKPAQGYQSPKTDEVCLTFCSQTVRRRAEGQEPWCRSVCIRRVFAHEVNSVLSQTNHLPNDRQPLPPEGQPQSAIVDGIVGGPNQDGRPSATDVRHWQEGFYIWFTKNRWAAQEKIDLMMLDLARHTEWIRAKEQEERAWFDSQMQRVRSAVQSSNDAGDQERENEWRQEPFPRHPYPDAAKESCLVKVPSSLPSLEKYTNKITLSSKHLFEFVRESIDSGQQEQFAHRAWETIKSGAPLILAKNVITTCWDAFVSGPEKK